MTIWVDAQISPELAIWLSSQPGVQAKAVRDLGLRDATDEQIFAAARRSGATIVTKDSDFAHLLERLGPPPQVIWVTCGNTSNECLRGVFERCWRSVGELIAKGEPLVEIGERS